ncbi:putative aarF domain-containing protein kinase 2, partial [Zootermopsis nevadensis]
LELSGPIFVKLGQWASTRKDLFTEELCCCLAKLQRRTSAHSWYYTKRSLERAFGPHWKSIFVKFDNKEPVGSGCCAQVYKAWIDPEALTAYDGIGPCNEDYADSLFVEDKSRVYLSIFVVGVPLGQILRDLFIMKVVASAVTWILPSLKWLSLVDCVQDFKQLMEAQVDFCVEAHNLKHFAENFDGVESVRFPKPLCSLVRPHVLVETYEEGEPLQHYVTGRSSSLVNARLAELGINTVFKMVFEDNFAHGDLHPGNILVREKDASDVKQQKFWSRLISKSVTYPVTIVILDCGIIASLDDHGKQCLKGVFKAVANGDIDVSTIMTSLFSTMIEHKVKLDGSFSSIILAIMVVEGLGKSLDPTIDIIQKARPFLLTSL